MTTTPTDADILEAFRTQAPIVIGARGRVIITYAKYEFYRGRQRLDFRCSPAPITEGEANGQ